MQKRGKPRGAAVLPSCALLSTNSKNEKESPTLHAVARRRQTAASKRLQNCQNWGVIDGEQRGQACHSPLPTDTEGTDSSTSVTYENTPVQFSLFHHDRPNSRETIQQREVLARWPQGAYSTSWGADERAATRRIFRHTDACRMETGSNDSPERRVAKRQ